MKKNKKRIIGITSLLVFVLCFTHSYFLRAFESTNTTSKTTQLTNEKLIIPSKDSIKKNGYPTNEQGQTYGPDMGNTIIKSPDLILAEGEDGVIGYISYNEKNGISSPRQVDDYNRSSKEKQTIPLYLQDGKTIIGKFKFN